MEGHEESPWGKVLKEGYDKPCMQAATLVLHHHDASKDDWTDIVAARRLGYLSSLDGKIKPSLSLSPPIGRCCTLGSSGARR